MFSCILKAVDKVSEETLAFVHYLNPKELFEVLRSTVAAEHVIEGQSKFNMTVSFH